MPKSAESPSRGSKTKKPLRQEIISKVFRDGTIVETLYNEDSEPHCTFAVKGPNTEPHICASYGANDAVVNPPERLQKLFRDRIVLVPSAFEQYGSTKELVERLEAFIRAYLDVDGFYISLLAHYALMTHVFDGFGAFPYLRFKGEPASGKSRALEVVGAVCYRTVNLGVSPSRSAIFRRADQMRSTLLIDEGDWEGDLRSDLMKLLNAGYMRNGSVSISVSNGDDWEAQSFCVGMPKILSNRLPFPDRALESRCLTVPMVSKRVADHIPVELPPAFYEESERLRNQQLQWRLDNLQSLHHDNSMLRGLDARARQLGLPIWTISPDPVFRQRFLQYLRGRSEELREDDPSHVVMEAVLEVREKSRAEKPLLQSIREVALRIALEREIPLSEFTSRRTAELLRSLQFTTAKWTKGVVVHLDPRVISTHCERFGLAAPKAVTHSDANDAGGKD